MTWKPTGHRKSLSWYLFPGPWWDQSERLSSALFFTVPTQWSTISTGDHGFPLMRSRNGISTCTWGTFPSTFLLMFWYRLFPYSPAFPCSITEPVFIVENFFHLSVLPPFLLSFLPTFIELLLYSQHCASYLAVSIIIKTGTCFHGTCPQSR